MSSQTSFVSVPSATRLSVAALNYLLQHVGARYEAVPNPAADGQTQGFRIEADGTQFVFDDALAAQIAAIDFSTETTLAALLAAFSAEDFATETTLALLEGKDFATQTTLAALLAAFSAEDFATQTTLAALLAAFSAEDFASETTLALLEGKDFATQTTLAALLAAFSAEDFATQTTLAALLAAFSAEDFASETTLSAIDTKLAGNLNVIPVVPAAVGLKQAAITVGTSAVRVTHDGSAPGAGRRKLTFMPDPDSAANFWYGSSTVTVSGATRGVPVFPGQSIEIDGAEDYYIISDTAAQTVFVTEEEA